MRIFINGSACISPQPFFDCSKPLEGVSECVGDKLNCVEPDYTQLLDPRMLRRMSRIIKIGMASGLSAMSRANTSEIDAIITGTGFGCLEDTSSFLGKMIDASRAMNPTSFIQSTHNAIGSQIALHLRFNGYNNTIVHSGFAFESALDDALLLLKNGEAKNVLVGGIDELTQDLYTLLKRIQDIKERSNKINGRQASTIKYGEGCVYLVLSDTPNIDSVEIKEFNTFYKPDQKTLESALKSFSQENGIVMFGKNGDSSNDESYSWIESKYSNRNTFSFKNLCGEYPTAPAFGLWLSAALIKGIIPTSIIAAQNVNEVLIYNCFDNDYHSFIRLGKC